MGRSARNLRVHLQLLSAVVAVAWGQNLDISWPIIHTGASGTMFGYSVALHREGLVDWLLVGAPKAQTAQPDVDEGGAVYKCPVAPLTAPGPCEQIPFDLTGQTVDSRGGQIADKSFQWFGASLKSSGPDGRVVACAPRYTWFFSADMKDDKREPIGHCYVSSNNFGSFAEYSPCKTENVDLWGFKGVTHCQAGFSTEISKDNSFVVFGTPGSYYLQGQIYVQNLTTNADPLSTSELPAKYDDNYSGFAVALGEFTGDNRPEFVVGAPRGNSLTGKVSILGTGLDTLSEFKGEQLASYFGHAVVVVDLNSDSLDDVVVGAPMYSDRRSTVEKWEAGKVYIYYQNTDHSFSDASTITGEMLRSRFGTAIASLGDVNQDGYNDIAVGAPYQGEDQSGVVFIYYGTPDGLRLRSSQVLRPADFNLNDVTTFGYSLSGGLDMDKNNYPDLLIGAQNSDTAVLVRARPVILIKAHLSVYPEGINLDNKTFALPDGTKVTSFEITSCFTYTGKHIPETTEVQYTLSLDSSQVVQPRALFATGTAAGGNRDTTTMTLTRDAEWCRASLAYVKPGIREKLRPISVGMEYDLNKDTAAFQPYELQPILSTEKSSVSAQQVYINNNCENNICIPDLQLKATTSLSDLVIGSSDSLVLNVVVFNNGQDAFQATFKAVVPPGLQFVRVERKQMDFSVTCSDDKEVDTLICEIGNPLMTKYKVDFGLKFSPYQLTSDKPSIQLTLSAMSENPEASAMSMIDNYVNVTVGFKAKVELALLGRSIPAQVAFSKEDVDETPITKDIEAGPLVIHVYEVSNTGPSDAGLVTFDVSWPMMDENNMFLLYLTGVEPSAGCQCRVFGDVNPLNLTIEENSEVSNVTSDSNRAATLLRRQRQADPPSQQTANIDCSSGHCMTVSCTISQLPGGASEVVKFWSRLWTRNPLFKTTSYDRLVISSSGVAKVIDLPYHSIDLPELPQAKKEVVTIASPEEPVIKQVPTWVIVLAVLGGLFLLFLVILILWKCGFFKRKKYEQVNSDEKRADL